MSLSLTCLYPSLTDYTEHVSITVQGDDSNYFIQEEHEFTRKPVALGMESGTRPERVNNELSNVMKYIILPSRTTMG